MIQIQNYRVIFSDQAFMSSRSSRETFRLTPFFLSWKTITRVPFSFLSSPNRFISRINIKISIKYYVNLSLNHYKCHRIYWVVKHHLINIHGIHLRHYSNRRVIKAHISDHQWDLKSYMAKMSINHDVNSTHNLICFSSINAKEAKEVRSATIEKDDEWWKGRR